MTVTKCDRCGAVYENPPKLMIGTLRTAGKVLIPDTMMCGSSDNARYDLCETCMNELIKFLTRGQKETNHEQ